jgi:hypothetical protein
MHITLARTRTHINSHRQKKTHEYTQARMRTHSHMHACSHEGAHALTQACNNTCVIAQMYMNRDTPGIHALSQACMHTMLLNSASALSRAFRATREVPHTHGAQHMEAPAPAPRRSGRWGLHVPRLNMYEALSEASGRPEVPIETGSTFEEHRVCPGASVLAHSTKTHRTCMHTKQMLMMLATRQSSNECTSARKTMRSPVTKHTGGSGTQRSLGRQGKAN